MILWSASSSQPVRKFGAHKAAVKALAWSPHQHGRLVSGGGTADRCIRLWNSLELKMTDSIDTGSQVCNLMYANSDELVSTHGYSQNQVHIWKYPRL